MGKFTTQQIEMISTNAINIFLCNFQNISPNINWNDKEPSWDGNIYLYEDNSQKKGLLRGRIPVQVKGTEVKRFSRKFHSFQMKLSDIKNYYYDGGVLFLVVEIIDTQNTKIFYKFLLPIELKRIMEEIKYNDKDSKAVHINNVLDEEVKFDIECNEFLLHRNRQGINAVESAITLEQVKDKATEIEIVESNIFNMIGKDVYFYTKDEFGVSIPVKDKVELIELSYKVEKDFIIDNKKYFDNFKIVNRKDGQIKIIGDGLEFDIVNRTITLRNSTEDIVSRLNTLEFIENGIENKREKDVNEVLKVIEKEKNLICQLIEACERFNIPKSSTKLCEMTENDRNVLRVLKNIKSFSQVSPAIRDHKESYSMSIKRVDFFGHKILLVYISDNENDYYVNYFQKEEEFDMIGISNEKRVSIGRFSILRDLDLLVSNFDISILKESIKMVNERCKETDMTMLSEQYNLLALEAIKAWDVSHNNVYLDLASYIFDMFEHYLDNNIIAINRAQIEKRINCRLYEKTRENLYRIKLSKLEKLNYNNEVIAAIDILLENEESFKKHFEDIEDKKAFMDYPIYTLYSKNES